MNWDHVKLIFWRELRDQLRDRRTMFTIAVLPLLLYPLMGMLMLQIAQFHRENPIRIAIHGVENWPTSLPLIEDGKLAVGLLSDAERDLAHISTHPLNPNRSSQDAVEDAKQTLLRGQADVVVVVRAGFEGQLSQATTPTDPSKSGIAESETASPSRHSAEMLWVIGNRANDRSQIADRRIRQALDAWQKKWVGTQLEAAQLSRDLVRPLTVAAHDIAPPATRSALVWSKLLPFVMLIWALTGAFYPAVDLCAGEKERGTLETLLSSPARRREIVWGKLLTVMCFSTCTALLNLFSMQFTAAMVMRQFARLGSVDVMETLGPLPISSMGWLIIMLLPISALFSALAMAVAALARSSKEGQYYLMPLLLVGMPLVMLPMMPGVSLSVGTCIVPVTGAVLLSRALVEGEYREALIHAPFVVAVTAFACLLAVRWAVRQFESESVMFRENERFEISAWLRHLWRDRGQTASSSEALLCGMIILVALFFGRMIASGPSLEWTSIAKSALIIQLAFILAPCLVMATMLTRSLRESLRFQMPRPSDLLVCCLLAVCLHPSYIALANLIQQEYSIGADTKQILQSMDLVIRSAPLWSVIFFLAIVPAICEEIAFRGFIFGGLSNDNGVVRAILVSSLFFGMSHGVLQQSISATIMGLGLGIIAWRSGSVLCTIVFHAGHNALTMWLGRAAREVDGIPSAFRWAFTYSQEGWDYSPTWCVLSFLISMLCFTWFLVRDRDSSFLPKAIHRKSLASN